MTNPWYFDKKPRWYRSNVLSSYIVIHGRKRLVAAGRICDSQMCVTYYWNLATQIFPTATDLFSSLISVYESLHDCTNLMQLLYVIRGKFRVASVFPEISPVNLGTRNRSGSHLRPGCDSCVSSRQAVLRGIPFTLLTTGSRRRLTIRDDDACKLLPTFLAWENQRLVFLLLVFGSWAFDETVGIHWY